MQDILKVSRDTEANPKDRFLLKEVAVDDSHRPSTVETISNPEEALQILLSQPDIHALGNVLQYLSSTSSAKSGFNIKHSGYKVSKILNTLVCSTIPDYWRVLQPNSSLKGNQTPEAIRSLIRSSRNQLQLVQLLDCLSSVSGLGALESRLDALLDPTYKVRKPVIASPVGDLLDVLVLLLGREDAFLLDRALEWDGMGNDSDVPLVWRELLLLLCTGRLLSTAARALSFVNGATKETSIDCWVADGPKFSRWLGRNLVRMARVTPHGSLKQWDAISLAVSKSFSLGYTDIIVEEFYSEFLFGSHSNPNATLLIMDRLPRHQQRQLMNSVLRHLSHHLPVVEINDRPQKLSSKEGEKALAGGAAVIAQFLEQNDFLRDYLISWLVGTAGGLVDCVPLLKAVIAAIALDQGGVEHVLEKSMQQFGDKLYIKHTPILLQEANVRVLLLSAGCVYRSNPSCVMRLARSSIYLNAISNRLATSSTRSRLLGMIVANTISDLVDDPNKRLEFSMDDMKSIEVETYMNLPRTQFNVGSAEDLKGYLESAQVKSPKPEARSDAAVAALHPVAGEKKTPVKSKGVISEKKSTDDDGLIPHEKPDSDKEDEEEDPTLVDRTKHNPPVYIRDLIDGLRDNESYERQRIALSTASSLIRRKSSFGTEVSAHVEDLATLLTGLHDKFDMERFQEWRLQGMIAILISQPVRMGQWFAKAFFDGDYSMSQRASILTTLGMGARELGGYKEEDAATTGTNLDSKSSFPSKLLPEKMHKAFSNEAQPVNALAAKMEKTMIQPMALEAADKLTGPDALKVRTFSSRMEVEKRRKKPIQNELAKVVADGFFYPLTGRWWMQLKAFGTKTIYFSPFLLSHYIKTLAIILHASGPSTVSLPQMTSEFWDLLISVTSHPSNESTVLETLMFAFLTILDLNEDKRRLAEEQSRELLETQRWTETVFENTAGGDEEGDRLKMLAASVLIKLKEVVERYQALLIGEML